MTDNEIRPKLAALRGLEAALHLHRSAEAARAAHPDPCQQAAQQVAAGVPTGLRRARAWLHAAAAKIDAAVDPLIAAAQAAPIWQRLAAVPWKQALCGPIVRKIGMWVAVAIGIVAVLVGALWWRLASGPISLDLATPWLTAAIAESFGSNYRVEVAGTVLERDEHSRTALRIRGIVVRASDGTVVASAPRAEIGLATGSLLGGRPRAESINLVGAELALRIETDGTVTVFAGAETRPIATSPVIATAGMLPRQPPQDRAAAAAASHARLENFAAMLSWIDSLGHVGLDGQDLTEVGLKNGVVVVDDLRSGVRSKFERINLSLTRPRAGELALRMGSDNPERPWLLGAEIKPTLQGARAIGIEARKVSLRDLLLAMRVESQIAGDLPISGSLRAEIGADGTPQFATGRVLLGPGSIGEAGDPESIIPIERAELNLEWDAVRRLIAAPFQIVAGGTRLTLVAQAESPREPGGPWNVALRGGTVMLPPTASHDSPLMLNRIGMRARFDPVKRRIDIDQADVGGKDVGVAMSGSLDFSTPDPRLAIGIAARNMSAAVFKQIWPVFVNPKVREWVLANMSGGSVERLEIATNAPMSTLKASGPPIPDDGLSIQVVTSGTTVRAVESLPPIRDADLVTRVKGRNVTVTLGRGTVELPSGRKLTLVNGVFEVPDTFGKNPPARARARIESPVPAVAELLAMDRLRDASSGVPLDPATSRGTMSAQVSLAMPLDPDLPKGALNYNINAEVTNFAVDKFVLSQRVEAQMLRVVANTQGYSLKGDVRIGGTPAAIEYRKASGEDEAEVRLQAVFDDAARGRFGMDLQGAVSGPMPLKLAGRVAPNPEQDSRFAIDADLTPAKIDNLLPGWVKPAGKPARATFNYVGKGKAARFDDVVIEGSGASVKGAVELDANGDLLNANFPVFGLADSDKASLKAEKTPDGVLKVTMRGDVYDGRNFIKSAMGGKPEAKDKRSIADLELDLKIGALAGFSGEALRALDLKLLRRDGRIRTFSLNAKLGIDTPLIGDLRGRQNKTVVYFETADAGALFRFTDTYARMVGGSMWIAMDPPTIDHTPQEGLLNVRDFAVRGEPALERVAGGGGAGQPSSVEFSRMRVEFVRTAGRMTIKEGLVRGPAVGATIDGHIDYAGNEIRMRGTFVPLYGLNNALNQIPIVGLFLGGSNEGLVGITYEVVGTPGAPVLRVNPISAVAPGILRKFFEFPSSNQTDRFNDQSVR